MIVAALGEPIPKFTMVMPDALVQACMGPPIPVMGEANLRLNFST